eukprot:15694024-Heterocapsa_arctica.AAC.1
MGKGVNALLDNEPKLRSESLVPYTAELGDESHFRIEHKEILFVSPATRTRDQPPEQGFLLPEEFGGGSAELPEVGEDRDTKH